MIKIYTLAHPLTNEIRYIGKTKYSYRNIKIKIQSSLYRNIELIKTQIEKEFTMVLYADSRIDPKTNKPEYFFNTYQENASAKCPPDIFGEDVLRIPNDLNLILEKTQEYVR